MDVEERLIKFFKNKGIDVKNTNDDLFEKGYIDSMNILEFICFIEEEFGVKFSNEDFISRKFRTIKGISEIISEKCHSQKKM